jgi:glucose/arabinose dehydrogenase
MSHPRRFGAALLAALLVVAFAVVASGGAARPRLPQASNGDKVEVVAGGVPTPTAFAFAGSTVFVGSVDSQSATAAPGGLFTLADGTATKVPNAPPEIFGLAWRAGTLYVSTGPTIVALGGWNGTSFSSSQTVYENEGAGFPGFNGLAFGPEGRLYAALALENTYDHSKDPFPLSQAVVSMTTTGGELKVVAEGVRQPFQMNFPKGSKYPFVTVLGQDTTNAPRDQIVIARPGRNYGFPTCTWRRSQKQTCNGFDEPQIFLPPHTSPMGIGSIGKTLYVALYNGTGNGPEVAEMSERGKSRPFLTGFTAPIVALGVNAGSVYVGELDGKIYKVAAR